MQTIGDYVMLQDQPVSLKIGGDIDHTFPFTIPNNINKSQYAILTLQLQADGNPHNLQWKIDINGEQVQSLTHDTFTFTAIQEVFRSEILNSGCVSSEGWHVQQGTNLPG
jgi:hypothetical protein